jgi:hypothetical protein
MSVAVAEVTVAAVIVNAGDVVVPAGMSTEDGDTAASVVPES